MSFDPTKPADHSPLDAGEMRDQLNGLNDLITNVSNAASNNLGAAISGTSSNSNAVTNLNISVSSPPQAIEIQQIIDKLNELINALRR